MPRPSGRMTTALQRRSEATTGARSSVAATAQVPAVTRRKLVEAPPTMAVVVVNYNSGDHLTRCIQSLHDQRVSPQRILVVDNASTDGSLEQSQRRFPNVVFLRQASNLGFAAANNIAIGQLGDVEWVALLNADAFAQPGWIEALTDAALSHPTFDMFACPMLRDDDPSTSDGMGDVYHVSGFAWRDGCGLPVAESPPRVREVFGPCAAAACYRREALVDCGGFDEQYFCYFEDVDLAFRLRLAGHRCLLVPGAVVRHVGSAVAGRRSEFTVYHAQRNLEWTWLKNMPLLLLLWSLPQHLLLVLLSLLWFALHGQGATILRSKWDAWKALPRIWRQRQNLQTTRTARLAEMYRRMRHGWLAPYRRSRK